MRKNHGLLSTIGIVLFSVIFLADGENKVSADESNNVATPVTVTPIASETSGATVASTEAYTNNSSLNQSISNASNEGLQVVETPEQTYNEQSLINEDYSNQAQAIQKVTDKYRQDKANYESQAKAYQDYVTKEAKYQKDLAAYQANQEEQKRYQKDLAAYQVEEKEYQLEKAAYEERLSQAQANTVKKGNLSRVQAQYLIFKSEPNATVSFEGVDKFFAPNYPFGTDLAGISYNFSDIPLTSKPSLAKGVGSATAAGSGDGYGLILEKGKPISVIYRNLEKSSYNGRPIKKVVYTYELTSTFSADNVATAFIYTDPTKTIYVGTSGVNRGQVDFNIHQTITYYYDEKERVVFAPRTTALISFASRNNSFSIGEQEYVRLGQGMTFIPITGSSVTGQDNYVASRGSNDLVADGSSFDRDDWDKDGSLNEYYGAGVAQVTGAAIAFDFGIHYQADAIAKSSRAQGLRNNSRQWFSVNSDIKAGGIFNATLRPAPIAPARPLVLKKPLAPNRVMRPLAIVTPIIFYHQNRYQAPAVSPKKASKTEASPKKVSIITRSTYDDRIPVAYTYARPISKVRGQVIRYGQSYRKIFSYPAPVPIRTVTNKQTSKSKASALRPLSLVDKEIRERNIKKNTGLSMQDYNELMAYMKDVAKMAQKKYGKKNKAKINQAIANAIAGISYSTSKSESAINDFNTVNYQNSKYFDNVRRIVNSNHKSKNSTIDLAHLMMPIATSYSSGFLKDAAKWGMTLPGGLLHSLDGKETFFWLNSYTGDKYTNLNSKDKISDQDAYIIWKSLENDNNYLYESFDRLYSSDFDRDSKLYEAISGGRQEAGRLNFKLNNDLATLTLGTAAIVGLFYLGKAKEKISQAYKKVKSGTKKVVNKIKTVTKKAIKKVKAISKKIVHRAKRLTKSVMAKTKTLAKKAVHTVKLARKKIVKGIKRVRQRIVRQVRKVSRSVIKRVKRPVRRIIRRVHRVVRRVRTFARRAVRQLRRAVRPLIRRVRRYIPRFFRRSRSVRRGRRRR